MEVVNWENVFPWSETIKRELRDTFGKYEFREKQEEVINSVLSSRDTFVIMPTGGGKSLCYQLPAVVLPGLTIVVSPLIALIQDQVQQIQNLGIQVDYLGAGLSVSQEDNVYAKLESSDRAIKLLFITPEKISLSDRLKDSLTKMHENKRISLVAIDEAHCISMWGRDFRPSYKHCNLFKKMFPNVPIVCLTATATDEIRTDVMTQLGLENVVHFQTSFNRTNLRYEVKKKRGATSFDDLCSWIKKNYQYKSGIVYCLSRVECEKIASALCSHNIRATYYHASLPMKERETRQNQWSCGAFHVIVATNAFGMGINRSNVRFVIHYTLPKSLEVYYQESGRAGRDGLVAHCVIYYSYSDISRLTGLLQNCNAFSSSDQTNRLLQNLDVVRHYCENIEDCRRTILINYLGEDFEKLQCHGTCDNCSNGFKYEDRDVTREAQSLINFVNATGGKNTLKQVIDAWIGGNTSEIRKRGHHTLPEYGGGSSLPKDDCERLAKALIQDEYLTESPMFYKMYGRTITSIKMGGKALPDSYTIRFRKKESFFRAVQPRVTKSMLISRLLQKLQCTKDEYIKDAIDSSVCVELMKQMAENLPRSLEDLFEECYTSLCPKTLLRQYGKKFIETINKFIFENPDITLTHIGKNDILDPKASKETCKPLPMPSSMQKKSNLTVSNWPPRINKTQPSYKSSKPAKLIKSNLSKKDKVRLAKKLV